MTELIYLDDETIECDGQKWVRRDDGSGDESWEAVRPISKLTYLWVKNYSTRTGVIKPNDPFSGWRVGSGGPFTSEGQWTSREEAIRKATPIVRRIWRDRALQMQADAQEVLDAVEQYLAPNTGITL